MYTWDDVFDERDVILGKISLEELSKPGREIYISSGNLESFIIYLNDSYARRYFLTHVDNLEHKRILRCSGVFGFELYLGLGSREPHSYFNYFCIRDITKESQRDEEDSYLRNLKSLGFSVTYNKKEDKWIVKHKNGGRKKEIVV